MTLDEARAEIARRKELGHKHLVLVVAGVRNGARTRVIPGVMGTVLGPSASGHDTIVDVLLDDFERGVEKYAPIWKMASAVIAAQK